jgi:hypothetical protein
MPQTLCKQTRVRLRQSQRRFVRQRSRNISVRARRLDYSTVESLSQLGTYRSYTEALLSSMFYVTIS